MLEFVASSQNFQNHYENGWISVSSNSPSEFKVLLSEELLGAEDLETEKINPIDAMLVVLDSDRYKIISI